MYQRRVVFAAFAVLAGAAWLQARSFGTSPSLLPLMASGTIGLFALVGMLAPAPAAELRPHPAGWRPLFAIAAFALYGALMPLLGFLVTTVGVAAGLVLTAGGLGAWRWAIVSVAFVLVVYVAFSSVFFVSFPAGIAR